MRRSTVSARRPTIALVTPPRSRGAIVAALEHRAGPPPLHFPEEELVPESQHNLERRTVLYRSLRLELRRRASVGSDQFVYWNPLDPTWVVAPDVFVRLGRPQP